MIFMMMVFPESGKSEEGQKSDCRTQIADLQHSTANDGGLKIGNLNSAMELAGLRMTATAP